MAPNYVNQQPNEPKCKEPTEKRLIHLIAISFGLLCMVQAILNISLRLTQSNGLTGTSLVGNKTNFEKTGIKTGGETHGHCNALVESFNKVVRDRDLLQDQVSRLQNEIRQVKAERERLEMKLREIDCSASRECPIGWTWFNRRCYFLSDYEKTWEDSRKFCRSNGGDLVVINSVFEQESLYRFNGDPSLLFWIGLRAVNGIYRWVDGSELTDEFWMMGQPDHDGCVEMYHRNPLEYSWNDIHCNATLRWLCERDPCFLR